MTWADFYLICFAVGLAFSFLSFLAGSFHWHLPYHLPYGFGHGPVGGPHVGAGQASSVGHAPLAQPAVAQGGATRASNGTPQVSPFNLFSLAAFLAWFGGAGFLLTRFSTVWFVFALAVATIAGLAGAAIIILFVTRVLMSEDEELDPADFAMVGVLGRVSSPIRPGGTGELIYTQAGTRRSCGARTEDGSALVKGEEVVVTRYEKGIAYVRRWQELAGEEDELDQEAGTGR